MSKKPVALIIMDGFGYNKDTFGNAIAAAKKPNIEPTPSPEKISKKFFASLFSRILFSIHLILFFITYRIISFIENFPHSVKGNSYKYSERFILI